MPPVFFSVGGVFFPKNSVLFSFSPLPRVHFWRVSFPTVFRVATFSSIFYALRAELCVKLGVLATSLVEGDEVRLNFRSAVFLFS